MTILLTGGGTGGHITPILAVAHDIKKLRPECRIVYIGERHGKYAEMLQGNPDIDEMHSIFAGKFRRYNGESWVKRMLDIKTNLLNVRDVFFAIFGLFQSVWIVKKIQPEVVFLKGGFVGVPVGLASALWHYPIITHDSDALPGLANRIVSRWVTIHATGMPAEYYTYPQNKVNHVGVLVSHNYQRVTSKLMQQYRRAIDIPTDALVLMVTGGSNGSQSINRLIVKLAEELLSAFPNLRILHQVGRNNAPVYAGYTHERLYVTELFNFDSLYEYSGAADVLVTRAGANTVAECGIQAKACIIIPNPLLTGGHQLKNATYLLSKNAACIVGEDEIDNLRTAIVHLLESANERETLGEALYAVTVRGASHKLAMLLLQQAER